MPLDAHRSDPARGRSRGGRPPKISREQILSAAAAFDIEELSLHAVAGRLGVTHAALYTYFDSKAALIAALVEERADKILVPDRDGLSWDAWLELAIEPMCQLTAYVSSDGSLASFVPMHPLLEAVSQALLDSGVSLERAYAAFVRLEALCIGVGQVRRRMAAFGPYTTDYIHTQLDEWGIGHASALRTLSGALGVFDVDVWILDEVRALVADLQRGALSAEKENGT